MDTNDPDFVACGADGEMWEFNDCGESTAGIARRNLASSFQVEMSESIEKFISETESVDWRENGSNAQSKDVCHLGVQNMQQQKVELIMHILYLVMFVTNKLHEHQMMDKLDPKPPAQ